MVEAKAGRSAGQRGERGHLARRHQALGESGFEAV
jgi:hypothetical protein